MGGNIAMALFLTVVSVFMIFPMAYMVCSAFKPMSELFCFLRGFCKESYASEFCGSFKSYFQFVGSVQPLYFQYGIYNPCGYRGQIVIGAFASYALANNKFAGSKFIFGIIVLSLMFPAAVTQVPNYIIMAKLKWIDTYLSVIVPAFCGSIGLYLLKQFMEGVPDALLESARIDGAGEVRILWRIVMPIVRPAWLTLLILMIQNLWNINSGYIFSEQLKTLTTSLNQIVAGGIARAGTAGAASVIMMLVPMLVFVFTQSNVIETMGSSGMKD
ncbi:MAG: carbohydrate ABC transporter permease [Oscillospiraceae bacterium]